MPHLSPVAPCDFVVFGGTGDLAMRKLLPALYLRDRDGQLPDETRIIAISRAGLDDAGFRDKVESELAAPRRRHRRRRPGPASCRLHHVSLDVVGDDRLDRAHRGPRRRSRHRSGCSTSPARRGCSARSARWPRPTAWSTPRPGSCWRSRIGHDLASARAINDEVGAVFAEEQIFRIDHYLGKETVQNLLVLRFANALFEPLWNAGHIDHVQITVAETIGVGGRGDYYDGSGALRDMVQNHLLQLLCLVAMEPPATLDREAVRDEKLKVLRALRPLDRRRGDPRRPCAASTAQACVDGAAVPGYLTSWTGREPTPRPSSRCKAEVANWRWAGVPFYLRTGKRLAAHGVRDRRAVQAGAALDLPRRRRRADQPNRLVIRLQPDEGMRAAPDDQGARARAASGCSRWRWTSASPRPSRPALPDAYERLLMDVVRGNPTLFMRRDEVEAAWAWVEPILRALGRPRPTPASPTRPAPPARRGHRADRARRPHLARGRMTADDPPPRRRRGHRPHRPSAAPRSRAAYLERIARPPPSSGPAARRPRPAPTSRTASRPRGAATRTALQRRGKPNIAIVSAYNDMLSAHQPFERFPALIKAAAREAGGIAQFAGGVPAMCDGVTQGRAGHGAVAVQPRRDRDGDRHRAVARHVRRRADARRLRQDRAGPADRRAGLRPPAGDLRARRAR